MLTVFRREVYDLDLEQRRRLAKHHKIMFWVWTATLITCLVLLPLSFWFRILLLPPIVFSGLESFFKARTIDFILKENLF